MTAAKATARGAIDAEVTVANLNHVGCSTAAGALGTAVPGPAVFRDETAATGAEGVVFALALGDGRGVVDEGCANLRVCGCGQCHGRKNAIYSFHIIVL